MTVKVTTELRELRAKAALYDELAGIERQLEQVRRSFCRDGVDPGWREIANTLATALDTYSLLSLRATGNASVRPASRVEDVVVDCGCGNSRSTWQRLEQRAPAQVAGARTAINRRERNSRSAACRR